MHLVLLTSGKNGGLSTQHLHQGPPVSAPRADTVDLLILDARHMSPHCFNTATQAVLDIRARLGLRHGILLCNQPTIPLVIACIRCGLRDIINHYVGAAHLRQLLRSAIPSLSRKEFRDAVAFLRTFSGFVSGADRGTVEVGRRTEELNRRAESLAELEKTLANEKDRLDRLDRDLRERTRRLDRQLARLQNDSDILPPPATSSSSSGGSTPPMPVDLAALTKRLDQRAAELDLREKMLNEVQALLLSTPEGAALREILKPASPA
jgi:hypothetical protein